VYLDNVLGGSAISTELHSSQVGRSSSDITGAAATSQQQQQQKLRLQLHVKLATGDFREIYALFCLGDTWNINSR